MATATLNGSVSYGIPTPTLTALPVVDLGYELHQAISFNVRIDHLRALYYARLICR